MTTGSRGDLQTVGSRRESSIRFEKPPIDEAMIDTLEKTGRRRAKTSSSMRSKEKSEAPPPARAPAEQNSSRRLRLTGGLSPRTRTRWGHERWENLFQFVLVCCSPQKSLLQI